MAETLRTRVENKEGEQSRGVRSNSAAQHRLAAGWEYSMRGWHWEHLSFPESPTVLACTPEGMSATEILTVSCNTPPKSTLSCQHPRFPFLLGQPQWRNCRWVSLLFSECGCVGWRSEVLRYWCCLAPRWRFLSGSSLRWTIQYFPRRRRRSCHHLSDLQGRALVNGFRCVS
jgi:hypothetical protein